MSDLIKPCDNVDYLHLMDTGDDHPRQCGGESVIDMDAELEARQTYGYMLGRGLSDAEAREEAWPGMSMGDTK